MLDYPTPQNDHPRPLCPHSNRIDFPDILDDVNSKLLRRRLECVEIEHVAQTPVGQCRREDGDVVFPRPVVYRALIVDFFPESVDDFAWSPVKWLVGFLAGFLLLQHFVKNRYNPVFEGAVVAIRHDEVTDAVHAFGAQ